MTRVKKPSRNHRARHHCREEGRTRHNKNKRFPKKTKLQRSLRVAGELFATNKELEMEKKDREEFGLSQTAALLVAEGEQEQQQEQIQDLQLQVGNN